MRLPMQGGEIDMVQFRRMVDTFLEEGFTYFDTAHGYHNGKSEIALREGLTKRHPRERYTLTNKLTQMYFQTEEDIRPFFASQLEWCGVEYFDYYLIHAVTEENYKKFTRCRAFETVSELKKEGKVRHMGLSFHDKAPVLDRILTEHPEVEYVQIQFNYADYDDAGIQGRENYEVCRRFEKPVIIMEPVKGGGLANLPPEADAVLRALGGGSNASYAIRYTASFDGVFMVLSGMSTYEQVTENIGFMKEFKPLTGVEREAVDKVRHILKRQDTIPCTACEYCVAGCPKNIPIPDLFACMNAKKQYVEGRNSDFYYGVHTTKRGRASDCIACKQCEDVCPQHLPIVDLLCDVSKVFDR